MRINQFVAKATGISRRQADEHISNKHVLVNGETTPRHYRVESTDTVTLNGTVLEVKPVTTIALHKPTGYVCSRDGQGSETIYDLLPDQFHHLKPVGRLDKDSSGLLIMTNDGELAHQLSHPSFQKKKIYRITLDKSLSEKDRAAIQQGIMLDDGLSQLQLTGSGELWTVTMSEGRNRQIRRTFSARGYTTEQLHRTQFGSYLLQEIYSGKFRIM